MIDGYVTFDELLLVTGLDAKKLKKVLNTGVQEHFITPLASKYERPLYKFKEFECWLRICID